MEGNKGRASQSVYPTLLPAVILSVYVSLQAPGGFLHAIVYPINLFV